MHPATFAAREGGCALLQDAKSVPGMPESKVPTQVKPSSSAARAALDGALRPLDKPWKADPILRGLSPWSIGSAVLRIIDNPVLHQSVVAQGAC